MSAPARPEFSARVASDTTARTVVFDLVGAPDLAAPWGPHFAPIQARVEYENDRFSMIRLRGRRTRMDGSLGKQLISVSYIPYDRHTLPDWAAGLIEDGAQ